ncbi:MAG: hypothetical protein Ta2G_13690 [Termitinemataceae bacterium]|nr:MAG: hypothetical protein Ta2G_13690 [Termitinemataceae bacterium]
MKKLIVLLMASLFTSLLLSSCLGMKTEVKVKKDGSGSARTVYTVSEDLLKMLNEQDGTDFKMPIPLEKHDFENAVKKVPGLKMTNYKSSDTPKDRIITVDFTFADFTALLGFLDSAGVKNDYDKSGNTNILYLVFTYDAKSLKLNSLNANARQMIPFTFQGYTMDFNIEFPSPANVRYMNVDGEELSALSAGSISTEKNKVLFSSPMASLLVSSAPVIVELTW